MIHGRVRGEGLAVATAVALRLGALWLASRSAAPWIDPDGYLDRAAALVGGVPWVQALGGRDGQIVPPLYTLLLALARRAGLMPVALLVIQALLGGVACAFVIAVSKRMAPRSGALAAGWAFALSPAWLSAAPAFWSEHLDVPIAALALLLLLRALRDPRPALWIGAAVACAAAALTRSISLYAVPAVAVIVWIREPAARRGIALALTAFAALTGAYIVAASHAYGRLLLIENSPEWHWRARTSPETAPDAPVASIVPTMVSEARTSPVLFAREAVSHVRATFAPAPWNAQTAEQLPSAVMTLFRGVDIVFVALLIAVAIAGFATAPDRTAAYVLGTWVAVHLVLVALSSTNAGPRYRAPLDPALFALAAAALRRV